MKQLENRKNGFTLVEVVVVLVILAILAAIMIPALTSWIDGAREKICVSNRSQLLRYYEEEQHLHYLDAAPDGVKLSDVLEGNPAKYPETAGDVKAARCPSGGTYSAVGNESVYCDVHGAMAAASLINVAGHEPDKTLIAKYAELIQRNSKNYKFSGDAIDSTATAGQRTAAMTGLLNALTGDDSLAGQNIKSWRLESADGATAAKYVIWTEVDVSPTSMKDQYVRTVRYDVDKKTYAVGYVKAIEQKNKTLDNVDTGTKVTMTYNVMQKWNYAPGTTDYNTYDEALAAYEKLVQTADTRPQ